MVDEFIKMVSERNHFQNKLLKEWNINENEYLEFENILKFYVAEQGYPLEFLADSYSFINTMVMEETYFFERNKKYRFSSFEEVNQRVYQNDTYMKKYMLGLCISDYIWIQHLEILRWFEQDIKNQSELKRNSYLEIGPGLGQYLIKALRYGRFKDYLAVDLSPTSVDQCKKYLAYCGIDDAGYHILQKDFFEFTTETKFDYIVMGEVLEHVERPLQMLKKIRSLLNDDGRAFIATVINAPAIDHIYLFRSKEEVLSMAQEAGFLVEDYICITAGGVSMDKAVKYKHAVNIAMILKGNRE